jgi:DNA-binding NarL/FixJ family response regulator
VPPLNPPAATGLSEPLAPITPAEQRVLDALRSGGSNRAIAAQLVISPRTVESHVSNLLAKTGCRNRTQLLLWILSRA